MKNIDLLGDLINGRITPDEADDICSAVLSDTSLSVSAHEALGMSRKEWTAYAHGVDFANVAEWRAHGWPERCFVCGRAIDSDKYGWLAREHNGTMQLKHIIYPKE